MGAILKLLFYGFILMLLVGFLGKCYNWITGATAKKEQEELLEKQEAANQKRVADSLNKALYKKMALDSSTFVYWYEKSKEYYNSNTAMYFQCISQVALRAGRTSPVNYPQFATLLLNNFTANKNDKSRDSLLLSIAKNDMLSDSTKFSMYEHTAGLYLTNGDTATAYKIYEKALVDSLLPETQAKQCANYYSDIKKPKKAIPYWEYLISKDSTNSSYKNNLGVCYGDLNQNEKAIEYFALAALLGSEVAKSNLANYDRFIDFNGNVQKRRHISFGSSSAGGRKSKRGGWGRRRR